MAREAVDMFYQVHFSPTEWDSRDGTAAVIDTREVVFLGSIAFKAERGRGGG